MKRLILIISVLILSVNIFSQNKNILFYNYNSLPTTLTNPGLMVKHDSLWLWTGTVWMNLGNIYTAGYAMKMINNAFIADTGKLTTPYQLSVGLASVKADTVHKIASLWALIDSVKFLRSWTNAVAAAKQNQLNGYGYVIANGTSISYQNYTPTLTNQDISLNLAAGQSGTNIALGDTFSYYLGTYLIIRDTNYRLGNIFVRCINHNIVYNLGDYGTHGDVGITFNSMNLSAQFININYSSTAGHAATFIFSPSSDGGTQANWTETSPLYSDYIKNKPTIISPVNADWNAVGGLAQILHKPTNFPITIFPGQHQFLTGFNAATGIFTSAQPNILDIHNAALVASTGKFSDLVSPPTLINAISVNYPLTKTGTINAPTIGITSPLPIANGGTNAVTQISALNNLLPTQTDNNGNVLTSNGSSTSWQSAYPLQPGNSGMSLITNGTSVSWLSPFPDQTSKAGLSLITDGANVSWSQNPYYFGSYSNSFIFLNSPYYINYNNISFAHFKNTTDSIPGIYKIEVCISISGLGNIASVTLPIISQLPIESSVSVFIVIGGPGNFTLTIRANGTNYSVDFGPSSGSGYYSFISYLTITKI